MYKIMVAIITTFIGIYSSQCLADATGCIVLDGNTYTLNLSSIAIDPDAEVGATLYTARLDTEGPKITCPLNSGRGKYTSKMLGSFQTLVGSNVYGNIYASGIEGIGGFVE